ncbi:polymorphic toxin-type HINT domain-containing protein [Micromonospora lupini]|uniref:polymorphic toxin-type HINT domain-containing protein n=1 Tax=Micromonospora lupini TaxID=285679 RepID=UPI001181B299|nr:polymorphic toxin-type HINT domain-containing protein [Micromonospora lupini]
MTSVLTPVQAQASQSVDLPALQTERSVTGRTKPAESRSSTLRRVPSAALPTPRWPAASSTTVDLGGAQNAGSRVQAGNAPVRIGPAAAATQRGSSSTSTPAMVQVQVRDRATADRAGVRGLLLSVGSADGRAGRVSVEVNYSTFRTAYGADYASRLRLVQLPACALTTPDRAACQQPTVLPTRNNGAASTLVAEVNVARAATVLAATAAASGPGGSYGATSLSATGSWSAGGSAGDFSWSYPMDLPASLGGPTPSIGLGYSSSSVDGRMVSTNNQATWVGDGWDYWPGYVERRYKSCADDMGSGALNTEKTGDLCWASNNVTLSLNGRTTELVRDDDTGVWRTAEDDGSRIESLTGASNGDNNGEYWRVTTTDGTQYYFGRNRLPNWSGNAPETKSTWTVPVFGNNSGEPCHASTFDAAWCQQGWRWNLDHVVDPHDNSMAYYYQPESNYYGRNIKTNGVQYERGGYLDRIEYGQRNGQEYAKAAPAKIVFGVAERCLPNASFDCAESKFNVGNGSHWPDVPADQNCNAGEACADRFSPTFWTRKRLTSITTQIRVGSSYSDVDSWTLSHEFPDTADGTTPSLWLASITRTGKLGGSKSMPAVQFTGQTMPNRVDGLEGVPAITRQRMVRIDTETGSTIGIGYLPRECSRFEPIVLPAPNETNTKRCYPVYWQPEGETKPVLDWFHKYVVNQVVEQDRKGGQLPKETNYQFSGPAWGYDDSEFTKADQRTWGQWRGYAKVQTRVGKAPDPISLTETRYFQGLHGDKTSTGTRDAQVVDSEGGSINDLPEFQGMIREALYYSADGGVLESATLSTPWRSAATATRARSGTSALKSYVTQTTKVQSRSKMADGSWRRTEVQNSFDEYGIPTQISDLGDVSRSDDNSCTRHEYARNTSDWLLSKVKRTEKVAVDCATTPSRPTDVVSETRMYYDGSTTLGQAPTKGDVTQVEELMEWPAGGPRYKVTARSVFDAYGRVTEAYDVYGNKTTTVFTPAADALVTQIDTINPKLHKSTSYVQPAWGLPTAEVDANGARTDLAYDPLGRLEKVWLPGRDKTANLDTPNSKFSYQVTQSAPVVVTTETLKEDGSYRVGYEIYDGMLRLRQTQQPAAGGGRILTDVFYDNRGLAFKKRAAYYNDSPPSAQLLDDVGDNLVPSQMRYYFDGMGRPTNEVFESFGVEKWRTVTTYGGDRINVTPPSGGTATTSIKDGLGRQTELRQYHGTTATGAYDATTYAYDRFGRLSKVKDPTGNEWTYVYDLRGRQIKASDPDKGDTTSTYDDGDRLTSTTDARLERLSYTYDELGRPKTLRQGAEPGNLAAQWEYDTLKLGLPTSSTRYVGSNAYTTEVTGYNARYQAEGTKYTIPPSEGALAGTYSFGASYTPNVGLPKTNTYPSGGGLPAETVTYGYDGLDMPVSVTGLSKYLQTTQYSRYGEPLRHTLGAPGKEVYLSYSYEEGTRRLAKTTTDRSIAPTRLDDIEYKYDSIGNITKIKGVEQSTSTDTQCFGYDYLRRMTEAWTATDDCAAKTPSAATVGGPNPYWHSYTFFDGTSNRKTEVQHDTSGNPANNVTASYVYPAAKAAQPHTLRNVTTVGPASGGLPGGQRLDQYEYDKAGNTTSRKIGGTTQDLTWDAEGHLSKVTEGTKVTEFLYDAGGSRLIRRDPGTVTLYLGSTEVTLTKATSTVTGTRYYQGVGAVRTPSNKVNFLLGDHHGTAQQTIDATTQASTRRKFTPYGQARGTQPSVWPGQKGFVGGTIDSSTGLTHLGAREYDAATGRFISLDPIVDFNDPQQMQGYAYANNSPVSFSDASGLRFCADDNCTGNGGGVAGTGPRPTPTQTTTPSNGTKAPSGPSDEEVRKAKTVSEKKILDVVIEAGGQILLEVLGINDIRDCVMKGDIGACAMAVAGALPWGKILKAKKIGQAMLRAGKAVMTWFDEMKVARRVLAEADEAAALFAKQADEAAAAAAKQADDAAATAAKQGDDVAETATDCAKNSFTPDTLVVMGDGSTKPIEDVQLGEEVLATDPESGLTEARPVVGLIVGEGQKNLVDVTVDTDGAKGDASGSVIATDGHPFWVADLKEWVKAADLKPGQWLRTSAGTLVQVEAVRPFTQQRRVHNLTVDGIHTYHVVAGSTEVLVHNCSAAKKAVDDLRASGTVASKRNIAAAEVKIDGKAPVLMRSVSGGASRSGMVANVGEHGNPQRLIPQVLRGGKNNRFFDTEFKILNQLANDLGPSSSSITGRVDLHTELPVCGSCSSVIAQFNGMFPGIRVSVTTG